MHCYGSPASFIQADCGDLGPHDEHDYTAKTCNGSPSDVIEADCGQVGPHDAHQMMEVAE